MRFHAAFPGVALRAAAVAARTASEPVEEMRREPGASTWRREIYGEWLWFHGDNYGNYGDNYRTMVVTMVSVMNKLW